MRASEQSAAGALAGGEGGREPGREKAKWWELEQQQLLLARHCSCPGIGSAASTHLQRCRCLRFNSPRRPVVLPGATGVLFFL